MTSEKYKVRADDISFGILHSRFHRLWMRQIGNAETFPFPAGMTLHSKAATSGRVTPPCMAGEITAANIGAAARYLNELGESRANSPAWLDSANKALDIAVAAAYGWTDYTPEMSDEELMRRLLALNPGQSHS